MQTCLTAIFCESLAGSFHAYLLAFCLQEGGGRKGLPKSFLNRFTRVKVELLQSKDLLFIAGEWACLTASLRVILYA